MCIIKCNKEKHVDFREFWKIRRAPLCAADSITLLHGVSNYHKSKTNVLSHRWYRRVPISEAVPSSPTRTTATRHEYARESRELERKEANGRPTGWPTTDTPLRVVACHKSCRSCTTGQEKRSQSYRRRATIRVSDWSVPAKAPSREYRKHDREYIRTHVCARSWP